MADTSSERIYKSESDTNSKKEDTKIEEEPAAGLKSYAVRVALKKTAKLATNTTSKRIFSYADFTGWVLNVVALFCAIGSGVILPLMDLILGKSVTAFTNYGNGTTDIDRDAFESQLTHLT
jgi:hypothetical protein